MLRTSILDRPTTTSHLKKSMPAIRLSSRTETVRSLPRSLQERVEHLSGCDMSDVWVHYDSPLPSYYNAEAFTYGNHIYLGADAAHTLAHEAWHVVQQKQGRVPATDDIDTIPINTNESLENEAHKMAGVIRQNHRPDSADGPSYRTSIGFRPVMQRWVRVTQVGKPDYMILSANGIINKLEVMGTDFRRNLYDAAQLNSVCSAAIRQNVTFNDMAALETNIKKKAFARTLYSSMNRLKTAHDALYQTYRNNLALAVNPMQFANNEHRNPTYIRWGGAFYSNLLGRYVSRNPPGRQENHIFQWLLYDPPHPTARDLNAVMRMNCYECVLYAGVVAGLYPKDYVLWAISQVNDPTGGRRPRFVLRLANNVNNIREFHSDINSPNRINIANNTYLPRPNQLRAGRIVVFGRGLHVGLSTGRRVLYTRPESTLIYGGTHGHGMLDLNQDTDTIRLWTVEDFLAGRPDSLDIGYLPDCPVNQTFHKLAFTVHHTATNFH